MFFFVHNNFSTTTFQNCITFHTCCCLDKDLNGIIIFESKLWKRTTLTARAKCCRTQHMTPKRISVLPEKQNCSNLLLLLPLLQHGHKLFCYSLSSSLVLSTGTKLFMSSSHCGILPKPGCRLSLQATK